ncbi:hypothetical protein OG762_52470 (plasmid) [Streptomyces sp. NBC_01136]|uniref:hypothetical protein n=1 Tax=Streptomyces sp. NBC_01136 TaxID=2903754 RepID=UPI00386FA14E|nr:hypothetical protein OG762_52470 [Streptomyces sp. NBC_01136]
MPTEPGYWHPSKIKERWSWYRGPWRERDACGAWCSRQAIESGESETTCRNGGSFMGPRSAAMKATRTRVMDEWRDAQHARFLAAEDGTRGNMVKKGAPAGVTPSSFFPAAPGHRPPFRWASEDLERYWEGGGERPIPWREFVRDYAAQWQHPLGD